MPYLIGRGTKEGDRCGDKVMRGGHWVKHTKYPQSEGGYVYFAGLGRYVKIGFTARDPQDRLSGLPGKLIAPDDLEIDPTEGRVLIHAIGDCVQKDERRIQGLFARHHVIGEWFHRTPDLLWQLEELRYVTLRKQRALFREARKNG